MAEATRVAPRGASTLKTLLAVVGGLASLVLISNVFFRWDFSPGAPELLVPRFPFGRFLRELPQHLWWLVLFVALSSSVLPLRAFQWKTTLPVRVPFADRYHSVAIGALAHNALPGKLGEPIRAFLLARWRNLPFVVVLGSGLLGKLLELAALMVLVAVSALGPFRLPTPELERGFRIAAAGCLGLVVVVVTLARVSAPLAARLRAKERLPRLSAFLSHVGEGFGTARSLRQLLVALVYALPIVVASSLAYGLGLQAIGVPHGLFAGAILLGAISLGQTTLGVPVSMGIYYFITSWAARAYGASAEEAAAFATMTHLGTVFSHVSVGAASLWKRRLRWSDLRRRSKEASLEVRHAAEPDPEPQPAR